MYTTIEVLNKTVFLSLNAVPGSAPHWLSALAIVLAKYFIYCLPLLLVRDWLSGSHIRRALGIKIVVVCAFSLTLNYLIGCIWPQPRPFVLGLGHTWLMHAPTPSFPSNHMTLFTSYGLCLVLSGIRLLGWVVLLLGCAVAWARVFLGVHFPLDMLGSLATASLAFLLATKLWASAGEGLTHGMELVYRKLFAYPIAWGWLRR